MQNNTHIKKRKEANHDTTEGLSEEGSQGTEVEND